MNPINLKKLPLLVERNDIMAKPNLAEKDILNPSEAIEYFVLSRREFYEFLDTTDGGDFLAYYGSRKLIIRVAIEKYLRNHPELRRRA
ncbi:DNA-binding protein [Lacrimispora sp. NSJ-141]|uniref:DNA-binding protein n=1 Tax=Lientehia hominis TaxID=2897778 RepID=A0AAP2WA88_9FIRM|nr:DNA-binding protein [Lientehia hominis]MCD2492957.1 DNA-binding protein [Lientehia hominis]